jgi:3-oxoacyl-[acyl-carrier-protein] synthase-1
VAQEPDHLYSDRVNKGLGLSRALARTLEVASPRAPFVGDLISDQNGENWRAGELSYARLRLTGRLGEGLRLMLPAISLGDVGAATAGVAVCVAASALVRGYSASDRVLIAASSEGGQVGSVSLRRMA